MRVLKVPRAAMDQGEKLAQTDRLERREHWDHPDLQAILEVSERRALESD
jgi:hypothetical protein